MKEFNVGDIVEMKKAHACGTNRWKVVRTGADVKIKCIKCGRLVMLTRSNFEKDMKKVIKED